MHLGQATKKQKKTSEKDNSAFWDWFSISLLRYYGEGR
jgi:hypothetical protein